MDTKTKEGFNAEKLNYRIRSAVGIVLSIFILNL